VPSGRSHVSSRGGATLRGQTVTWWDLAEQARIGPRHQNVPRIVVAERADNFTLYRITLKNSPNFHVVVSRTNGFTAWGVKIDAPAKARNTDGIDPSSSSDVTIVHSSIRTGDDHVAIKAGAAGPSTHITVAHNHFYTGHGMSIGSETNGGVSDVEVRDLTIEGADNGLRIKSNSSRGGIVRDVVYQDVCLRNVRNPLVFDSFYDKVTEGTLVPLFGPIRLEDVRVAGGGAMTIAGADRDHPVAVTLDGVAVDGAPPSVHASHATVTVGPGRVDFVLVGPGVSVRAVAGERPVPSCDGRFVPFPRQ
jgi:polygalacturonase